MRKLLQRLQSRSGESLVEAMASVLIFTLSSILLFTMITSAVKMNKAAQVMTEDFEDQLRYTEKAEGPGDAGSVSIQIGGGTADVIPVRVYQRDSESLYSFFRDRSGG